MRRANFRIAELGPDRVVLRDLGPHDFFPTITNDAESVVERIQTELPHGLEGRRLFYYDSDDELTEIVVRDGKFAGFRCGGA